MNIAFLISAPRLCMLTCFGCGALAVLQLLRNDRRLLRLRRNLLHRLRCRDGLAGCRLRGKRRSERRGRHCHCLRVRRRQQNRPCSGRRRCCWSESGWHGWSSRSRCGCLEQVQIIIFRVVVILFSTCSAGRRSLQTPAALKTNWVRQSQLLAVPQEMLSRISNSVQHTLLFLLLQAGRTPSWLFWQALFKNLLRP